jgi:8-oxo-dGTP pyrophosphatase MutT (NUDIX family)
VPHLFAEIPRPKGFLPGGPAPWAQLGDGGLAGITVNEVRRALTARSEVPVLAQVPKQVTLAELPPQFDQRPAAVLCLLFEQSGEANVVLTRRPTHLRSHAGEVCFPGGRLEHDETPLQAGLREANEEIGVDIASVEVIAQLTPLTTMRSPALVRCFVCEFPGPAASPGPPFVCDPNEVDKVFWVPLARLATRGVYHEELWPARTADGGPRYRAVSFFQLEEDTVWGATGRLLTELLGTVLGQRGSLGTLDDAGGRPAEHSGPEGR